MTIQKYQQPESGITFGQQHMDATDFVPPRVKVVQAMSKEAQDDRAVVGDFYNTLTGENYGKSLLFIPLTTFKNRVLIVRDERQAEVNKALKLAKLPETTRTGLACRSLDMFRGVGEPGIECEDCPLSAWHGQTPPVCTETYNVAAMNTVGDLVILSFAKSAAKTGKKLISTMRMRRQKPWTSVFEATTVKVSNAKGTFAVPEVRVTADRTPDELLSVAQEWITELTGRVIDVTPVEEIDDEDALPSEEAGPF